MGWQADSSRAGGRGWPRTRHQKQRRRTNQM
jgi:hypothetical protein